MATYETVVAAPAIRRSLSTPMYVPGGFVDFQDMMAAPATVPPGMLMLSGPESSSSTDAGVGSHHPHHSAAAMSIAHRSMSSGSIYEDMTLPGGLAATPRAPAGKGTSLFETPVRASSDLGMLTPFTSSVGSAKMLPMTPTSVDRRPPTAGVCLDFTPVTTPGGVNPFYSPPSYIPRTTVATAAALAAQEALAVRQHEVLSSGATSVATYSPTDSRAPSMACSDTSSMPESPESAVLMQPFSPVDGSDGPRRKSTSGRARAGSRPLSPTEKPHVCASCSKCFKRLEHLKRHVKIHTEERPFTCDVRGCERKFSRSDNLRAHRRTHMKRGGRNAYIEGLADN